MVCQLSRDKFSLQRLNLNGWLFLAAGGFSCVILCTNHIFNINVNASHSVWIYEFLVWCVYQLNWQENIQLASPMKDLNENGTDYMGDRMRDYAAKGDIHTHASNIHEFQINSSKTLWITKTYKIYKQKKQLK